MPDNIPSGITREDVLKAIADYEAGTVHAFGPSTGYDLVFGGRHYPPKAIVGLAARRLSGRALTPNDFKGGEGSRCFQVLRGLGFDVSPKESSGTKSLWFIVGEQYTRNDIYDIVKVPEPQRRGNWETGYTRWGDDLFVFSTVGSAATGGFDYDNGWEGDVFRWFAKEHTRLDQPQIQWILTEAERVFIFTRPKVRTPFTFEGTGFPISWEDRTPVLIRWRVDRTLGGFPDDVVLYVTFIEGARRTVTVNAYERDPKARKASIDHYGYSCVVCGFNFSETYGEIGNRYIQVHHLTSLATIGHSYEVNPITDLRPVCPNCHAMLHIERPPMSIEALRGILDVRRRDE